MNKPLPLFRYRISLSLPGSRYERITIFAPDEESARGAVSRHYSGTITDIVKTRPATEWELKQLSNHHKKHQLL